MATNDIRRRVVWALSELLDSLRIDAIRMKLNYRWFWLPFVDLSRSWAAREWERERALAGARESARTTSAAPMLLPLPLPLSN